MRTIKASEVVKGMRVRIEQPWGPETTRTVEGPIRRVEDRAPHFRFLTIGNGDLTVGPEDPVTVLAEPEPEWVEGAWYWVSHRAVMENRVMRRVTRGWSISSSHDLADYSDSEITVLGRVLIVDWPGDKWAADLDACNTGDSRRLSEYGFRDGHDVILKAVADAIRTQGGAR